VGTHQISMLRGVSPGSLQNCWIESYEIFASNKIWRHPVIRFKDLTGLTGAGFYGSFPVPQYYMGNARFVPIWTTTATTGNVRFATLYRSAGGDDTESLDQAGADEGTFVIVAAPGAAHRRRTASLVLTSSNFSAGDTVEYYFARDDSATGTEDTAAADVVLHDLMFQFTDT
jgi:hypothetical protein